MERLVGIGVVGINDIPFLSPSSQAIDMIMMR
jgi:hypothetical protein